MSLDSFKFPKRKSDLAANKSPLPSLFPAITKVISDMRYITPIILPVWFNDSSPLSIKSIDQLDKSYLITMSGTEVIKSKTRV